MRPLTSSANKIAVAFGVTAAIGVVVVAVAVNTAEPRPSPAAIAAVTPAPPAKTAAIPTIAPPPAKKLSARERKRQEEALVDEGFCGPQPEKLGDTFLGAEQVVTRAAHDPSSVDFIACSDVIKLPAPDCWQTFCKFRAKNMLGAMILDIKRISKSSIGWRVYK